VVVHVPQRSGIPLTTTLWKVPTTTNAGVLGVAAIVPDAWAKCICGTLAVVHGEMNVSDRAGAWSEVGNVSNWFKLVAARNGMRAVSHLQYYLSSVNSTHCF
jgi:hypothetical protein